jgi:Glycosyltransferase family 87
VKPAGPPLVAAPLAGAALDRWQVAWQAAPIACTIALLGILGGRPGLAADFHYGAWHAAHAVLAGRNPYTATTYAALLAQPHAFVTPPLLALIAIPLAPLPFGAAATVWSLVCATSMVAACQLLGIRSWRLTLVVLCSYPFVQSILDGQPDGLLALALAATWRYRDTRLAPVTTALLIAAKLLAWPLVAWLLLTGRRRSALTAVLLSLALLAATWAPLGFKELTGFPALLSAVMRVGGPASCSFMAALMRLGLAQALARALGAGAGLLVAALVLRHGRRSDMAAFVAALSAGLLVAPMLRVSYLASPLIPLAVSRARLGLAWLPIAALYLTPENLLPAGVSIAITLASTTALALLAASADGDRGARI